MARTTTAARAGRCPAAALALALAAAGCGGVALDLGGLDGGLDTGPLERRIEADLEERVAGVDIDRVDCPGGVEPQAGRVFVCRAHSVDGSVGTVEVTQVDDAGTVEWELTDVAAPATPTP
jgi:hypothetical protein